MGLGLIGLLGALQIATPADTSKVDSIAFLRDSVIEIIKRENNRAAVYLPSFSGDYVISSRVICIYSKAEEKDSDLYAALCIDVMVGRMAFSLTSSSRDNSKKISDKTLVDWDLDGVDLCYSDEIKGGKKIEEVELTDIGVCRDSYYPMLRKFRETKRKKLPGRTIS